MFARNWRFLVTLVALVAIAGCSEPSSTRPETINVTGTVTHNGNAVEGARVTFSPSGAGHAATGTTNASGVFSLTSFEAGDGAVEGSYAVAIQKMEGGAEAVALPAGVDPESPEAMDAAYKAMEAAEANPNQEAKDLLPAKYKNPATSGFTADVAAGAENNFTFEMTD